MKINGKISVMMSFKFGEYTPKHIDCSLVCKLVMLTFPELMNFYCLITFFFSLS